MKTTPLILSFFLISFSQYAQVQKNILLEHFTNTKCSVCATKNPTLNTNLLSHPEVFRVSYHPSSPYNTCVLNLHNVLGNDDRTNQYGIYGATPRLVIQGEVQSPNVNFGSTTLFDPFQNQTSSILLNTSIDSITADSVYVKVVATTVGSISLASSPVLYVGLAEDTIFYNAPNGEPEHFNVFRKALNGNQGFTVSLASTIGDSVVYSFGTALHGDWNPTRIVSYALLQDLTSLDVIQVANSNETYDISMEVPVLEGMDSYSFRYDPYGQLIHITLHEKSNFNSFEIFDLSGRRVLFGTNSSNQFQISFAEAKNGIYLLRLRSADGNTLSEVRKFIK